MCFGDRWGWEWASVVRKDFSAACFEFDARCRSKHWQAKDGLSVELLCNIVNVVSQRYGGLEYERSTFPGRSDHHTHFHDHDALHSEGRGEHSGKSHVIVEAQTAKRHLFYFRKCEVITSWQFVSLHFASHLLSQFNCAVLGWDFL